MDNNAEAAKLGQILKKIQADLAAIKSGASTQQLQNTSIEITQGRGYIPILENGVEKHRIGRQPDGTVTSVSVGNTNPPIMPNAPQLTPFIGGVTVACSGFSKSQYLDFSHINVYVDSALVGTLMKVPESIPIAPLDYQPHLFQLSSVNLTGTESAKTAPIAATPKTAVGADLANGIIDTLKLADDAVTNAKVATGAITNIEIAPQTIIGTNILPQAITTDLIAANTIQGNNIAAQAITALQIATNTITANQIAANAIQADEIAAGAVNTDKLAANSVTTDKVLANAITALQIAANAVTAGAIQAGSVSAEKLAAQVILASQAIIAGNPTGQRVQLDSSGLYQVDGKGNLALQLGTAVGGNSLTVLDPLDSTNALASIGSDGSMTMSGININGKASLNGVDLVDFLNSAPNGVQAQGIFTGPTPSTKSEIGFFELSCDVVAGRSYQVTSDNMRVATVSMYSGGSNGAYIVARYTTNGTTPTINSPQLAQAYGSSYYDENILGGQTAYGTYTHNHTGTDSISQTWGNHQHYYEFYNAPTEVQINKVFAATQNYRLRVLYTVSADVPARPAMYLNPTSYNVTSTSFSIIDLGLTTSATGGSNSGGGSSSATGTYTTVWSPTYTAYYADSGSTGPRTDQLKQGKEGSTNWMCMLGFNYADIDAQIGNGTVTSVKLFLYSDYWALSSGGYACVGLHNAAGSTPPSSYSFTTRDILDQQMKKPQGMYLTLPNSVGAAFAANTAKGFVLDSRATYPTTSNLGTFKNKDYTDATRRPSLTITYTK